MVATVEQQEVLICCDCAFGETAHDEFNVKQWHVSQRLQYPTLPLDADWFRPEPGVAGEEKMWRWRQMIKHAQEFWSERA